MSGMAILGKAPRVGTSLLLSRCARATPAVGHKACLVQPQQTRSLWHRTPTTTTACNGSSRINSLLSARPRVGAVQTALRQLQQARGMKLRSAITKRCEHCKAVAVRDWAIAAYPMIPNRPASDVGWLNGPGAGMGEMYDTDGLEPTLDSGRLGSDDKISHAKVRLGKSSAGRTSSIMNEGLCKSLEVVTYRICDAPVALKL
ncbi:hypothetical protein OOU_Y34scaffold00493g10 [Pyricularia oryzae Y34]|uniref:Uncharacterized protein n=1 Tax=Pyricularia oryzae (strain Y34) TaxID=1143189 RepID=A0AA97P001_PYRO3|nr:hypothetical protein OOU_Y34scaffold00493g10 [Pyricularia oryzae Y34]